MNPWRNFRQLQIQQSHFMASFHFWKPAGFWQPLLSPLWAFESLLPLISFPVGKNFLANSIILFNRGVRFNLCFQVPFYIGPVSLSSSASWDNLNYTEIKLLQSVWAQEFLYSYWPITACSFLTNATPCIWIVWRRTFTLCLHGCFSKATASHRSPTPGGQGPLRDTAVAGFA